MFCSILLMFQLMFEFGWEKNKIWDKMTKLKKKLIFLDFFKNAREVMYDRPPRGKKCFLWINSCKRLWSKVRTRLPESMKRKWGTHFSPSCPSIDISYPRVHRSWSPTGPLGPLPIKFHRPTDRQTEWQTDKPREKASIKCTFQNHKTCLPKLSLRIKFTIYHIYNKSIIWKWKPMNRPMNQGTYYTLYPHIEMRFCAAKTDRSLFQYFSYLQNLWFIAFLTLSMKILWKHYKDIIDGPSNIPLYRDARSYLEIASIFYLIEI